MIKVYNMIFVLNIVVVSMASLSYGSTVYLVHQRLTMFLLLDGNSEICLHGRSDLGYLICLRHLFKLKAIKNLNNFLLKRTVLLYTSAVCSELPSNVSTMILPKEPCKNTVIGSNRTFLQFI